MKKCLMTLLLGAGLVLQNMGMLMREKPEADLKAMVDALGNEAEEAFLSGDIDEMLQYYCDDVISMPNAHPMIKGKSELKRKTEAIRSSGIKFESLESTTMEAQSSGDFIYEIGTFSQIIVMPGSKESVKQTGKYVTIWKRQPDGKLKIAVEIYNSNESPHEHGIS